MTQSEKYGLSLLALSAILILIVAGMVKGAVAVLGVAATLLLVVGFLVFIRGFFMCGAFQPSNDEVYRALLSVKNESLSHLTWQMMSFLLGKNYVTWEGKLTRYGESYLLYSYDGDY